jgi:hypothetical protein
MTTKFQPDTNGGPWNFVVFDPKTGLKYTPATTGQAPVGVNTATWVEHLRAWVMWFPNSPNLFKLAAPADPRTGTWAWSTLNYTTDNPVIDQTGGTYMWNRLHYIAALDVFAAIVAVDRPMQYWKP